MRRTSLAVFLCLLTSAAFAESLPMDSRIPAYLQSAAQALCDEQKVPPALVYWLVWAESRWHPYVHSHNEATPYRKASVDIGLCQINSLNLEEFGKLFMAKGWFDPWEPVENLAVGVRYLGSLKRELGSWERAVAAYNCGSWAVEHGRIPESTQDYVALIMGRFMRDVRLAAAEYKKRKIPLTLFQKAPILCLSRPDGGCVCTGWFRCPRSGSSLACAGSPCSSPSRA